MVSQNQIILLSIHNKSREIEERKIIENSRRCQTFPIYRKSVNQLILVNLENLESINSKDQEW